MKRLLLPLLAALALPAAVNAEATYLTCDLNEKRSNNEAGKAQIVGRNIEVVPNPNSKFSDWGKMENSIVQFTLNEASQTGSVFFSNTGSTQKIDLITFQPESIVISNSSGGYQSYKKNTDTFSISRLDGTVFREYSLLGGSMILEYRGACKKSEPKKTLF
tara:strand:+ start:376 stop:858 length:483 start_codon:yes stop_codon:yes gene_type:complete